MSGIDERHKAMEAELAHSSEMRFRVNNRRNKLLGLWAAELLGKTGDEAADYARQVVMADFEEVGDGDVIRKVVGDLAAAGVATSHDDIAHKLHDLALVAHDQIQNEK